MLTLADIKTHLRVTHNQEDTLIQSYLNAAQGHISRYLGTDLPDPLPAAVEAAVLLLAADLYFNRESQSKDSLNANPTYQLLLMPYRDLGAI